ncbi:MAG: hypothetical protein ACTHJ3_10905 [Pararhizobium sp.]
MADSRKTANTGPKAPDKPSGGKHNIAEHSKDAKGAKQAVKDRTKGGKS